MFVRHTVAARGGLLANRLGPILALCLLVASLAACGGGGGAVPPNSANGAPSRSARSMVAITIVWPQKKGSTAARRRDYVSDSTASVTISVNGGTATATNNPNLTPGTSAAGTQTTTLVDVPAPVGPDTFTVSAYDAASGGGNLLGSATISYTVNAGAVNSVGVTLNGNLAKIACTAVAPFTTETAGAFTQVGPTGQLSLEPEDADGNIIIAPGTIPSLTLTAAATDAKITATSTTNEFNTNVLKVGTAVNLTASGTDLGGTTISSTCAVTRVLAMYVTNDDILGTNPSITIYPASATGAQTPVATIAGSNTEEAAIQFPAVDAAGNLFVSNEGPVPGTKYGPTSGYISIYTPGADQNGNVAPAATIAGFNRPEGLSFDPSGNLWAVSLDRITEYPPSADGVSAAAASSNVIIGANTQLVTCYGLTTTATTIYTTCTPYPFYIAYFPLTATGNATPSQMTYVGAVAAAGMTVSYSTVSWLSVAVDSTGMMYTPDTNNNENAVYGFAAGSTGMTPALIDATAAGFNLPSSIFIDANGTFYVTNYGSNSVFTFSSSTDLLAGITATSLSGTGTGLNHPYGVTVR